MVNLFQGDPYVIGADLRNEPAETPYPCGNQNNCKAEWKREWHKACMHRRGTAGIDPRENWPCAAQHAGGAIVGLDHRLLIFVEGIGYGTEIPEEGLHHLLHLRNGKQSQLVYSAHTYSQDGTTFDKRWGYLVEKHKAPVWIGEFGDTVANHCSNAGSPSKWLNSAISYLAKVPASWSWWPINGTDSDGGIHYESERSYYGRESYGLLCPSWDTEASEPIMEDLDSIMQER